MAADINTLVDEFREIVEQLMQNCKEAGYPMEPDFAIRTPVEQAALWRRSRTGDQVAQEIQRLRNAGAGFLADCSGGPAKWRACNQCRPRHVMASMGRGIGLRVDGGWQTKLVDGFAG